MTITPSYLRQFADRCDERGQDSNAWAFRAAAEELEQMQARFSRDAVYERLQATRASMLQGALSERVRDLMPGGSKGIWWRLAMGVSDLEIEPANPKTDNRP